MTEAYDMLVQQHREQKERAEKAEAEAAHWRERSEQMHRRAQVAEGQIQKVRNVQQQIEGACVGQEWRTGGKLVPGRVVNKWLDEALQSAPPASEPEACVYCSGTYEPKPVCASCRWEAADPSEDTTRATTGERMQITIQRAPRCLWHSDCDAGKFKRSGIMRVAIREEENGRDLFECLHCGRKGWVPDGTPFDTPICVDVVATDPAPPASESGGRERCPSCGKIASVLWLMYEHARLYMRISGNVEQAVREALDGTGHEPWQPPDTTRATTGERHEDRHGICNVCGQPWPCNYATDPAPADRPEMGPGCGDCGAEQKDIKHCWCQSDRLAALERLSQFIVEGEEGDYELIRQHLQAGVPDHWACKNPGLADQYRAEALACRRALGFSETSDSVAPSDLTRALAAHDSGDSVPAVPSAVREIIAHMRADAQDKRNSEYVTDEMDAGAMGAARSQEKWADVLECALAAAPAESEGGQ